MLRRERETRLLGPTDKREGERSFLFFLFLFLELSKLFSNRL
jgi:hypothetical protein